MTEPVPASTSDSPAESTAADVEQADVEQAGSGLVAEKAKRLAKLDEMRRAGTDPYPYRFDRSHTLDEVREAHGALEPGTETEHRVSLAGRVMLIRDSGKLVFATMRDRAGEIQLFVSRAVVGDVAFVTFTELDLGDWVGVHGTVMTTRKGELSVKVDGFELLSKAVRPLPDKWHGLTDIDTRFRQRYADLIVNDEARRAFQVRHAVISSFRNTLDGRGFIEVETPVLHVEAGGAHARPFITHHNALDMQLYLRIALELHLKRLIVGGMERVFEIGRIFRNEGISTRHNPEFTMMELYQAFGDYTEMIEITEALITTADATGTSMVTIHGGTAANPVSATVDLAQPWRRARMIDLVHEAIGVEVHPSQPVDQLRELAAAHGVSCAPRWGQGKIIEELFEATAEHALVRPTFVTGHPVEISPLARADRHDPFLTERFELFIGSREIANGYSELNDPVEQRVRFEAEQIAKELGDDEAATAIDHDYLRALEYSIKEVILFPTLRPEVLG
ncbi:MAG: lysS [Acidimicrobiaceae bacterium]|nr:MAG: lysS [Acidimicrobiaceae bacterium]